MSDLHSNEVPDAEVTLTLGTPDQPSAEQAPIDPDALIGMVVEQGRDRDGPFDYRIDSLLAEGGRAWVFKLMPVRDDRPVNEVPPRTVKVSKDQTEEDNRRLLEGADLLQLLKQIRDEDTRCLPRIFHKGRLETEKLEGRTPAYMTMEYLYPNPLEFLRGEGIIGRGKRWRGLHPNIALLILRDVLSFAKLLAGQGYAHGDINPSQIMVRMSPFDKGKERWQYGMRLDNLQFETVIADPDTIRTLREPIDIPYYTLRYGDPDFLDDFKYTRATDVYSSVATFYTLLTGEKLLEHLKEPDGLGANDLIYWWKEQTELHSPFGKPKPLFSPDRIYQTIQQYVPKAKKPTPPPPPAPPGGLAGLPIIGRFFAKPPEKPLEPKLNDQQEAVETVLEILRFGLAGRRNRKTFLQILRILDDFRSEQASYLLYDDEKGRFANQSRSVPVPFRTRSHYERELKT